jgi:hypothetical protein
MLPLSSLHCCSFFHLTTLIFAKLFSFRTIVLLFALFDFPFHVVAFLFGFFSISHTRFFVLLFSSLCYCSFLHPIVFIFMLLLSFSPYYFPFRIVVFLFVLFGFPFRSIVLLFGCTSNLGTRFFALLFSFSHCLDFLNGFLSFFKKYEGN